MDLSRQISLENLSHAYVIEGEREAGLLALRLLVESFGIATKANPDYHEYEYDALLLEHAQNLRREQGMYGAEGAKKIFVIAFNAIFHEAQNALLKTLEEPTEHTHFFFLVRSSELLLPTVRSRMQVIRSQSSVGSHESSEKNTGVEFLKAPLSERMNMIERMTKAKTDDKPKAKEAARNFLESLERALYKETPKVTFGVAEALQNVITAKRYLSDRSPSLKLLLEHLALTTPKV
jgi:DNA polymerase III delta prime subunit